MKLISWNVNGLRACLTHGFAESFATLDADIFSVQETKMQPGQADFAPDGYTEYTYSAEKKGYSGTACWCREQPLTVTAGKLQLFKKMDMLSLHLPVTDKIESGGQPGQPRANNVSGFFIYILRLFWMGK